MNRNRLLRMALSLVLAMAMVFSPIMSCYVSLAAFAVGTDETVTEDQIADDADAAEDEDSAPAEEAQEPAADEVSDEDSKEEETPAAPEEQADVQDAEPQDTDTDEQDAVEAEAEPAEDAEAAEEAEDSAQAKTEYVYKDKKVRVTAKLSDASAVPDDAELVVTMVDEKSGDYDYDAYMDALNQESESVYDKSNTLLYDIAFIQDGIELQPSAGTVAVDFEFLDSQLTSALGVESQKELSIIHLPLTDTVRDKYDTTADAKKLDADDIDVEEVTSKDNDLEINLKKETIKFELDNFSLLAVSGSSAGTSGLNKPAYITFQMEDGGSVSGTADGWYVAATITGVTNNNGDTLSGKFISLRPLTAEVLSGGITYGKPEGNADVNVYTNGTGEDYAQSGFWYTGNQGDLENGLRFGSSSTELSILTNQWYSQYDSNVSPAMVRDGSGDIKELSAGSVLGDFIVKSIDTGSTGVTVKLAEKPSFTVDINFYDYDGENLLASPSTLGDTYYLFTEFKDGDTVVGYDIQKVDIKEKESISVSIDTINALNASGNETGQKADYLDSYTANVRLLNKYVGNYSEATAAIQQGNDTVDGYSFQGQNDKHPSASTGVTGDTATINLKKDYEKKLKINLNFDPAGTISASGKYYVLVKSEHETTYGHEYTYYSELLNVSTTTDKYEIIVDTWQNNDGNDLPNEKYSTNWNTEVIVLKLKDGKESLGQYSAYNNSADEINAGGTIGKFTVEYVNRLSEDPENRDNVNYYNYDINLTAPQLEDALTPEDILGDAFEFGIVAHRYEQSGHTETNFAVHEFKAGDNIDIDGSGEAAIPFYAGSIVEGPLSITNGTKVPVDVFATKSDVDNGKVISGDKVTMQKILLPQDVINAYVTELINSSKDMSDKLAGKTTMSPTASGAYTLDTTGYEDNKTIYVNADGIADVISASGDLTIKKLPGQSIVFNFSTNGEVKINKFKVIEMNADGTEKRSAESTTSALNGDPALNQKVDEVILSHITFNAPNATSANILDASGLFLFPSVPEENKVSQKNGAGWIATSGTVDSGAEWHFYRHERHYRSEIVGNEITINKKDDAGTLLTGATFVLYKKASDLSDLEKNADDASFDNDGNLIIKTYTGGTFKVKTSELENYWPSVTGKTGGVREVADPVTLYLKETQAPTGYSLDTKAYPVVISATAEAVFNDENEDTGETRTEYFISIEAGKASKDIINEKLTDDSGSLKITKNVTVNGTAPTDDNKSAASGTFTFKVKGPGADGSERTINITITNGVSNTVTVSDLVPGSYTVTEVTDGLPEGFALAEGVQNTQTVEVTANNTAEVPTATFTNNFTQRDATGKATLKIKKALGTGDTWPEGKSAVFKLTAQTDGAPMPTAEDGDTVTLTEAGEGNFGAITYPKSSAGKTYKYTISETAGFGSGWTKSGDITATVVVGEDTGSGNLETSVTYSPDSFTVTNSYDASGTATLKIKKALGTGDTWPEGKSATFTLTAKTDGAPMPTGDGNTVTLTSVGEGSFGEITYPKTSAGQTYEYKISETSDFGEGWTKSEDIIATVAVEADNGTGSLSTTVTYNPDTFTVTNDYSASGTGEVKVKKILDGREWTTNDSFKFTIAPVGNAPSFTKHTATITSSTTEYTESFGNVTFSEAGTYQWTVSEEHKGETINGVAYDTADKTVTIVVEDDGNGNLVATQGSALVQTAEFTNTYSKSGEGEVKVQKSLIGRDWATNDSFEFTITPIGSAPAFDNNKVTISSDTENYTMSFGKVKFTEAGTYQWTVSETHKGDTIKGVKYDENDKTITIEVEDDGNGNLVAKEGSALVQTAAFTNNYSAEGTGEVKVQKTLNGRNWATNDSFEFTITPVGNAPAFDNNTVTVTKNSDKYTESFGTVTFTEAGTYQWKVSETHNGETIKGVTYDSDDKTVTIVVKDNGEGQLVAETGSNLVQTAAFTNNYSTSGKETLQIKKALGEGDLWPAGKTAVFKLTAVTEGAPLPEEDGDTVTLSSVGSENFGEITYPQSSAGKTYEYKISETSDFGEGWTKSGDITATVVVGEDDGSGELKTTVTYDPDDFTVTNDYSTSGEGEVKVKKNLDGRQWTTNDSFEFTITPVGNAPVFKDNKVTITKDTADYTETFGKVTFTEAGTYEWTVTEAHKGETIDGVAYDSADKTVTIVVKDNGKGHLVAEEGSALVKTAEFTNTYAKSGTGEVKVQKNLSGREWATDDSFEFTITPVGDAPKFTTNKVTVTNESASYTESFGKVTFTEAGKYQWTVSETHKGESIDGIDYADADQTITIEIKDDGKGHLVAEDGSALVQTAAFTNKYAATGEGELKVKKNLVGRQWTTNDSFEFTLEPVGEAPMPESTGIIDAISGAITGKKTIKVTNESENLTESFGKVEFTKAGTYQWTISEKHSGDTVNGVKYDSDNKTVTIVVKDDGKGKLVAEADSNLIQTAEFTNKYAAEGQAQLFATKDLTGRALEKGAFTFQLKNEKGDVIDEKSNDADGNVAFDPIKYVIDPDAEGGAVDQTGDYEYTISEVIPEDAENNVLDGITYDDTVHTVKVKVEDAGDGTLTVTYAGEEKFAGASFSNAYAAEGEAKFGGNKSFEHGDLSKQTFEFEVKDKDGNLVATGKSNADGELEFGTIKYTLDDLKQADGTYENSKTFEYIVKEVIPDTADENGYDKDADIQYDTSEKTVKITVTDDGKGTLNTKVADDSDKLSFTNAKKYGKLKLKKSIEEFDAGKHENATLVFKVTGKVKETDADGNVSYKDFEEYLNVHFNADSETVQTEEITVPLDTELKVEEVYSANYKPAPPQTIKPEDLITKVDGKILDEPYYEVSFFNELVGHTHTQGIINKYTKDADGNFIIEERVGSED